MNKSIKLYLPEILDFSLFNEKDEIRIVIFNTVHKFANDAEYSGLDKIKQPIFGSNVYINGKKKIETTYGLPFIRFSQGSTPKITYENKTLFTFNIHYHGLNTVGSIDGVAGELIFGKSTLLGPLVTFQFPKITNNQTLLWYHAHNMFVSMELIYAGIVGLVQIVDKQTELLNKFFKYGNNQILLEALDMDLTEKGTQTSSNLVTDQNRSNFTIINGISVVNWYSSEPVQFINHLYHTTNNNLVKIDILNASLNWRVYHLGVCDKYNQPKNFYIVQTDCGLINPKKVKMVFIPVSSRISIIIDLNDFEDDKARLFFYNYDLTEIFNSISTYPNQPNNHSITATIPDLYKSKNPTPNPTPIPSSSSNLNYPQINTIPQIEEILDNGNIKVPCKYSIKPFLEIKLIESINNKKYSIDFIIDYIKKIVFGCNQKNIDYECFEYNAKYNYLAFLNENYFYNLPNINMNVPIRNIFLFPEVNINSILGGNCNGTTEYVNGANRVMVDLWNSNELNLEWAYQQYYKNPNNYKPPLLPTSKFKIFKTNDQFSNTAMISNDTLKIEFFEQEISYGNFNITPISTITLIFPETKLMNIQEWIDLINKTFKNTSVNINNNKYKLYDIITCDWSFFPYALNFLYEKTSYIKSAVIKTINKSNFYIRFLGRWPLLQFFGKPMTGDTLNPQNKFKKNYKIENNNLYIKCDEYAIYGIYDAEIQQIFPFYATADGDKQLPIACMKRNAELIILPNKQYIGLYDGYYNDNLNSFSVKLKSSEKWIYTNGDNADAHPLHFHLTSGFALANSITSKNESNQLIYSRDIYQIGPQETVSFYLTWPYYSSYETTISPNISGIGAVIHCHFLQHNDSNSMMIQYFVDN